MTDQQTTEQFLEACLQRDRIHGPMAAEDRSRLLHIIREQQEEIERLSKLAEDLSGQCADRDELRARVAELEQEISQLREELYECKEGVPP